MASMTWNAHSKQHDACLSLSHSIQWNYLVCMFVIIETFPYIISSCSCRKHDTQLNSEWKFILSEQEEEEEDVKLILDFNGYVIECIKL